MTNFPIRKYILEPICETGDDLIRSISDDIEKSLSFFFCDLIIMSMCWLFIPILLLFASAAVLEDLLIKDFVNRIQRK